MSWAIYKNGNYTVSFDLENGTKVRHNDLKELIPTFPESFDFNITNKCDGNCPFCYQGCTAYGEHGAILDLPFLDSIHPYTEIAINGNDLTHPDLIPFLEKMREKDVVVSMTVNQKHFESNYEFIKTLIDSQLIHGLGVSLVSPTQNFIARIKHFPNVVIHVINGIITIQDLVKLSYNGLKILVLGYKELNRGKDLYALSDAHEEIELKKNSLSNCLPFIIKNNWFDVISFDNLALKQLHVRSILSEKEWNEFYMGSDGATDNNITSASMYIDAVKGVFAKNSCCEERFPLRGDITEMYQFLVKFYEKNH